MFGHGNLMITMPAVYHLRDDKTGIHPLVREDITTWGWCNAQELLRSINYQYQRDVSWTLEQLFERFPLSPVRSKRGSNAHTATRPLQVLFWENQNPTLFTVTDIKVDSAKSGEYFVPAKWTKAVIEAVEDGGRKTLIVPGMVFPQLATEDEQLIRGFWV
jgi:hypothetical protein